MLFCLSSAVLGDSQYDCSCCDTRAGSELIVTSLYTANCTLSRFHCRPSSCHCLCSQSPLLCWCTYVSQLLGRLHTAYTVLPEPDLGPWTPVMLLSKYSGLLHISCSAPSYAHCCLTLFVSVSTEYYCNSSVPKICFFRSPNPEAAPNVTEWGRITFFWNRWSRQRVQPIYSIYLQYNMTQTSSLSRLDLKDIKDKTRKQ